MCVHKCWLVSESSLFACKVWILVFKSHFSIIHFHTQASLIQASFACFSYVCSRANSHYFFHFISFFFPCFFCLVHSVCLFCLSAWNVWIPFILSNPFIIHDSKIFASIAPKNTISLLHPLCQAFSRRLSTMEKIFMDSTYRAVSHLLIRSLLRLYRTPTVLFIRTPFSRPSLDVLIFFEI